MKAIIFCAGLGTRLRPLTNDKPKAMVALNGKPLLGHKIEQLKQVGISEIVVNVHHFANLVKAYIESKEWGIPIHISDETNLLLDTGGGLKKAEKYLKRNKPFLIHNVDIFSTLDIEKMLGFHVLNNAFATLAIRDRKTSRYLLFDEKNTLSGWKNIKTEEEILTRNTVKNSAILKPFAFSGIHIVSPKIFDYLPEANKPYSIIPAYLEISKTERILGFQHQKDTWIDVGTPEKLKQAEEIC